MEFKNDKFIAFADKMIANYEEENNDEIFTIIELFDNVVIEFKMKFLKVIMLFTHEMII